LLQQRHLLNALLPLELLGVVRGRLLDDGRHVHGAEMLGLVEVLLERVGRVDGVELLRSILAGVLDDDLLATRVLREELGDIVGASVNDNPAVRSRVVLGDLDARQLRLLVSHLCSTTLLSAWRGSRGSAKERLQAKTNTARNASGSATGI
jgi:hypothetical protein